MTFVETFEFETEFGRYYRFHEARAIYSVTKGRAQRYGQPAEAPEIGDIDFEINLSGTWTKCSDDMHDFLLQVIGDDLEWLIEAARHQALDRALD